MSTEGAALAASILLHVQLERPLQPAPFRFAIFIGASLPFSVSPDLGVDVTNIWSSTQPLSGDLSSWLSSTNSIAQEGTDSTQQSNDQVLVSGVDKDTGQIRHFHPDSTPPPPKISIPVAHIYGRKDPYYTQSLQLVRLCDQTVSSVFEHEDGHCIPRGQRVSKGITNVIEKTIYKAEMMC